MSPRVLVIEDSELGGKTLVNVLEAYGHEVRWERTARAGVALAKTWQPDAAVVDRHLPDGDGIKLAAELQTCCDARIVVVSGDPAPDDAPVDATWLQKPVSSRQLVEALA